MARARPSGTPPTGVELSCLLNARADQVWSEVTSFRGINAELMPILKMTAPRDWKERTLDQVRPGQELFRSWLLLFGVVPIDYDDLFIAEVGPGYRFLERSQMLTTALWEHERLVEELTAGSCRVIDRVRFAPRCTPVGPVLNWFVPRLFAHRHRRLRVRFSSGSG